MKSIEQILASGKVFQIDPSACMRHAEILRKFQVVVETSPWSSYSKSDQLLFKVAFISICHQFNWDFMQNTLADHLLGKRETILEILGGLTAPKLEDWLKAYPKKERIRAKERAQILRDIPKTVHKHYGSDAENFYEECSGVSLGGGEFQNLMDKFEGYRTDWLRKKTNVLSHDLARENIISFPDLENLEPAIDYHIMRLYLRSGRVVPMDEGVYKFLEGAPNPRGSLVRELRKATAEAEKLTSFYSGINVADLNFVEWQVGRSVCINNERPHCTSLGSESKLDSSIASLTKDGCPYKEVCLSRNELPRFMLFQEPAYISKDY